MTTSAALTLLLLSAGRASAHDYPIAPVRAVLRVEPDRVVADLDADSIYWIEEVVGLHPLPPGNWPPDALAKAEAYVNQRLRLDVDGRRLQGRLISAEYVQRPWEVNEQGRVRLRLAYPPVSDAATLSGEADFYEDYRQERLEEHEPFLPNQDFRTFLTVPGRVPRSFELKPGAFAFSIPVAQARRGALARLFESALAGARAAGDGIAGWPALAALALSLAPGAPSKGRAASAAAAVLAGAALARGGASAEWAAGLAAALAAGRWLGAGSAPWLEAAALAALGSAWSAGSLARLPRAVPGLLERLPSALGLLLAVAAALAAGVWAATEERRRLTAVSESRAAELFERRRRLAATALLIVCGGGLLQGLAG
jgi:hypothetical protein